MKKVYDQFSSDPDVGALYGESLMDLHPWDLYDKQTHKPRAWTPELVAVLEHLMKIKSQTSGRSSLLHPCIGDLRIARKGFAQCCPAGYDGARIRPPGTYAFSYLYQYRRLSSGFYLEPAGRGSRQCIYNSLPCPGRLSAGLLPAQLPFPAATAALEGNSKLAWMAARKLQQHTATAIMEEPGWGTLQHYYTIPYYVAVKFALWDTILALKVVPGKNLVYPQAIEHYARGMAYLGKQDLANAQQEANKLKTLAADTTLQQLTIWGINTTADLVQIAQKVLSAEIGARQNQLDAAIALLNEAVKMEDHLNYNEPPDWFFSVRHHLGAVLLKAGKTQRGRAGISPGSADLEEKWLGIDRLIQCVGCTAKQYRSGKSKSGLR